jgi:hypothetical protein
VNFLADGLLSLDREKSGKRKCWERQVTRDLNTSAQSEGVCVLGLHVVEYISIGLSLLRL